jgi:hypothetical protein
MEIVVTIMILLMHEECTRMLLGFSFEELASFVPS